MAKEIINSTDPKICPSIKIEEDKGKKFIVMEVPESPRKPVLVSRASFKRVGKVNKLLSWDGFKLEFCSLMDKIRGVKEKLQVTYEAVSEMKVSGKEMEDFRKELLEYEKELVQISPRLPESL